MTRFRASKGRLERTTRFRVWVDDVILREINFDFYEKKKTKLEGWHFGNKYLTKETIQ